MKMMVTTSVLDLGKVIGLSMLAAVTGLARLSKQGRC